MARLQGTLHLTRSVLTEVVHDPATERQNVVSGTAGGVGGGGNKVDQITQSGGFRQYGNGNIRLILGSAQGRTQTLALRALTPSQVEVVKSLVGHTVCYRDTYGRKVYGAFLDIQINTIPFSGKVETDTLLHDIGLVIQSVTYDEAV